MTNPIIFFDGICNLCISAINFIIRYDKQKIFRFSPLQSTQAKINLEKFDLHSEDLVTIVLLFEGEIYVRSDAIIKIFQLLKFPLNIFSVVKIIPSQIRNTFYDFITTKRYLWFGKLRSCIIPDEKNKMRFL